MHRFLLSLVLATVPVLAFTQSSHSSSNPRPPVEPSAKVMEAKNPEAKTQEPTKPAEEEKREARAGQEEEENQHYDVAEVPPILTHHQITLAGKLLKYTATAGRLPIKRDDGKIEAEMFFVAYTLDDQNAAKRPLLFAFNGGPGSASIWLHMGALGPKRAVLEKDGFMPAAPYRSEDNLYTALDKADLVLVDAIGTGFSRAANWELSKKYWGVKGDIAAFGEFIRLYLSRYERWTSPLYLLGESYGTTRAAGVSAYLADHGISFNGIILLSMVLNFETLDFTKTNDQPYILILPSYTMIAAYHKKLPAELMQDLAKTRQQVEHWAATDYAQALAKGDGMSPAERQTAIDQLARYTGLPKSVIDVANLRIDVREFTRQLLIEQKVRVGRLDGRFAGPDPKGAMNSDFYDPTSSAILPPYTSVFNQYVHHELGYQSDMPYKVFAFQTSTSFPRWDWGSAIQGFPDTAMALREAITKNPYLKVLVMEGYYDLATPYYAADYTIDHLDLSSAYRKNIAFRTYDSGHMVYLRMESLAQFKRDVAAFIDQTLPPP